MWKRTAAPVGGFVPLPGRVPRHFLPVAIVLADMVYCSFLVPAERVRGLVPAHIPLAITGQDEVFVSMVAFRATSVGIGRRGFFPFRFNQLNLRTYVLHPRTGEEGPYFLRCALTSGVALRLTRLLGYCWEPLKMLVERRESIDKRPLAITAAGALGGDFSLRVEAGGPVLPETADDRLVNLFVGLFPTTSDPVAVVVSHTHRGLRTGKLLECHFPLLQEMGIADRDEFSRADSVVLADGADFVVFFPSEPIREGQNGIYSVEF